MGMGTTAETTMVMAEMFVSKAAEMLTAAQSAADSGTDGNDSSASITMQ